MSILNPLAINTDRLTLQPIRDMNEPIYNLYKQILGSDNLARYLPKGCAYNEDEIRADINNRIAHWQRGFGTYAIYLLEDSFSELDSTLNNNLSNNSNKDNQLSNQPIGYAGVEVCPNPAFSDIRYGLIAEAQGFGYATEAAKAVIAHTFKLGQHDKIIGAAISGNTASITILEKLGMTLDLNAKPYGEVEDLLVFSVKKSIK